ncbi:MAG: hypothetical protein OXC93_07890, partial [Rhodospirillaceae bacterium]|nr:hypothetical protein [Rhodospirillaceae bacterium]
MRVPSLVCGHFLVTKTGGAGTGASFRRFPVVAGDHLIGDRGYATASGGPVMVRVNTGTLRCGMQFAYWTAGDRSPPGMLRATGTDRPSPCRKAALAGRTLKPTSLAFAQYAIVFTTFPESGFTPEAILDRYRGAPSC